MMIRNFQKPLFFTMLLLLMALACQAAANPEQLIPAAEINSQTVVAQVVATVRAELPEQAATPSFVNSTAVNAQSSADLESILIEIYERINPSVVHIFVFDASGFLGSGAGFVFDSDGHVVTNNHVIESGATYEVVFPDGQRRYGNIIGTDANSDLAVLKVTDLPANAAPLVLGNSGALRVGQFVIAIGNPFGEASSMSVGVISGLGRTLETQRVVAGGTFSIPQVIQTDAAINPGNSGGPLLNLAGEVVGVNSAILSRTGANSGVGFAVPVNAVRNIIPALVTTGEYEYPYMGISMRQPFTLRELEALKLPPNGVWVADVGVNTPAEAAGLIGHNLNMAFVPQGDYIIAINGVPVSNSDELLSYLVFETQVGETVELTVIRNGEELIVPLTLGKRP